MTEPDTNETRRLTIPEFKGTTLLNKHFTTIVVTTHNTLTF